jgi:hypothetical protein
MIDRPDHEHCREGGQPLDGIRLRLPVPKGHHHMDVVASFAKWLCHRHGLEPFDLQCSESGGTLSLHALTPSRTLELSVRRARDAVRRAEVVSASSARLQSEAASIQSQSRELATSGREKREVTRKLRASTADLRRADGAAARSHRLLTH